MPKRTLRSERSNRGGSSVVVLGPLGAAGKSTPGQLAAAIFGVISFSGDLQQGNKIGVAISGSPAIAAGLIQGNLVGSALSGTISVAGDLMASVPNDVKFWFDGLPFDRLSSSTPAGGVKPWFDGLPAAFIS